MIGAKLIEAAGNGISTVAVAEAIDFDGTNDYLRRTSDLTGNATRKTFTFSAWIWQASSANGRIYHVSNASTNNRFTVRVVNATLEITGTANTNAVILTLTAELPAVTRTQTFYHVLVSIDMANTANRKIYINDIAQTVTATTYTNAAIPFNQTSHTIAGADDSADDRGRLSNVYLDYTYRDLSIEANRRLFVTADLKPAAGQAALNPILYLPMDDPTQPGLNAGTGGNFTLTGTVARSGRGPNQYNAPYSDLDGTADYLSRASVPSGAADNKTFAIAFNFTPDTLGGTTAIFAVSFSNEKFLVYHTVNQIRVSAYNVAGSTQILNLRLVSTTLVVGRNYNVVISCDLANSANRYAYVNGVSESLSALAYVNDNFDWTSTPYTVGSLNTAVSFNGRLGALWFNTSYIDLSQPANLAKFVTGTGIDAKPVDLGANGELPTGTSPLIYLPMYGNDAGKNYGTGGDFTVNSGPYTGARGPNEYWGNLADFNGTTGYLAQIGGLTGISDSKVFSCSFVYDPDVSNTDQEIINIQGDTHVFGFRIYREGSTNQLNFVAQNSSNVTILSAITSGTFTTARYFIQASFDLNNSSNRAVYVNGTLQTMTYSTYTNDTADLTRNRAVIAARFDGSYGRFLDGQLSEFYFANQYVDFSQEANRLKFRDAFGNPVNLTQQIEDAAIPYPAIYMRFPPTAFGTNYGTGGNFTVNGTITDGGQL